MPPRSAPILWPNHWYQDDNHIRCIVADCEFTIDTKTNGTLEKQWDQLDAHSKGTAGPEHNLLQVLLRQTKCAIDECDEPPALGCQHFKIRVLLNHEITVHGSTTMSEIFSFVTLVRERRIRCRGSYKELVLDCGKHIFDRMMEKVRALPEDEYNLLVEKGGRTLGPSDDRDLLEQILAFNPLKKPGEHYEDWWPVAAEDFLWFCHPLDTDPANDPWRVLWKKLRKKYAEGHI